MLSESGNWRSYICNVNDALASIFLDLEYYDVAPVDGLPVLAWLFIKLKMPDDRGCSTDEEFEALCSYEDDIFHAIAEMNDVHYVGRITTQGMRQFYFYTSADLELDKSLDVVVAKYSDYLYQFGSKPDQNWTQYLELLYPGPQRMEQIEKSIAQEPTGAD